MRLGLGVNHARMPLETRIGQTEQKPTVNLALLAERRASGMTLDAAAKTPGLDGNPLYSDRTAANRALKSGAEEMSNALMRHGVTYDYIAQKIKAKLDATVVKLAQHEGEFTDAVELDDHSTQLAAVELAGRFHRLLGASEAGLGGNVNVAIVLGTTEAPPWAPQPSEVQPGDVESGARTAVVPSQPDIVPVQSQPIAASPVAAQTASPTRSRSQGTGSAPAAAPIRTLAKIGPVGTPCKKKRKQGTVKIIAGTRL